MLRQIHFFLNFSQFLSSRFKTIKGPHNQISYKVIRFFSHLFQRRFTLNQNRALHFNGYYKPIRQILKLLPLNNFNLTRFARVNKSFSGLKTTSAFFDKEEPKYKFLQKFKEFLEKVKLQERHFLPRKK